MFQKAFQLLTALAAGVGLGLLLGGARASTSTPFPQTSVTIEQIQSLAELVSVRVKLNDVQVTKLSGYVGGIQAVLVARGEAVIAVDLTQATIIHLDPSRRVVQLRLPLPRVLNASLNLNHSEVIALEREGFWRLLPLSETDATVMSLAYGDAQQRIAMAAAAVESVQLAQEKTTVLVQAYCQALGWKAEIEWASES